MTIEIETPRNKATEKLIKYITTEIVRFSTAIKKISRAEILLKEDDKMISGKNKICDIRLSILGGSLSAHNRNGNFEAAAEEAIKELYKLGKEHIKKKTKKSRKKEADLKVK